ncbi:MAG: VWA domain-containing protein [Myxococcales bacterium]
MPRGQDAATAKAGRVVVTLLMALGGGALGACATGKPLEVKKVDAVAQPPSNVAVYMKITREDGQPVSLVAADFKVFEDGKQLPSKKVKRALLPVQYAVDRFVFVVVDLSGPLVDSEYLSTLQDAVASLADRIGKEARLGLSAFDGDGLVPFVTFDDTDAKAGLVAMRKFRPRSRNIDLWGTFISALDTLDRAQKQSPVPHRQATLILVTDRRDKAGRHSQDQAMARIQKSSADVYVIGIGDTINREELEPLGKTAALFAAEPRDLEKPFVDLADRIESQLGQDYLFSYCSPQKPGKKSEKHEVELRIATSQWHGSVEHEFSTKGFTLESCDAAAKPEFRTASTKAPAAAKGDSNEARPKKKKKPKPEGEEESDPES